MKSLWLYTFTLGLACAGVQASIDGGAFKPASKQIKSIHLGSAKTMPETFRSRAKDQIQAFKEGVNGEPKWAEVLGLRVVVSGYVLAGKEIKATHIFLNDGTRKRFEGVPYLLQTSAGEKIAIVEQKGCCGEQFALHLVNQDGSLGCQQTWENEDQLATGKAALTKFALIPDEVVTWKDQSTCLIDQHVNVRAPASQNDTH